MSDEIDDRLSRRFDSDDEDDVEGDTSQADMRSGSSQNVSGEQKAQNVKKEWNVRSFYLDDDLDDELTTAFKRLDLELSEADADIDLKKTRHYYPLIVELGLEQMEGMDVEELTERLERTER